MGSCQSLQIQPNKKSQPHDAEETVPDPLDFLDDSELEQLVQFKPPPRKHSGGLAQPFHYQPHSHYSYPGPPKNSLQRVFSRRDSHSSSSSTGSWYFDSSSRDLAGNVDVETKQLPTPSTDFRPGEGRRRAADL